jgi:hypothetical protein
MTPDEMVRSGHRSRRLPTHDSTAAGIYYVTMGAEIERGTVGRIENAETYLRKVGKIVRECWLDIPLHYTDANLHTFVIIPNHAHGSARLWPDWNSAGFSVRIGRGLSKLPLPSVPGLRFTSAEMVDSAIISIACCVMVGNPRMQLAISWKFRFSGKGIGKPRRPPRVSDLAGRGAAGPRPQNRLSTRQRLCN